MNKKKMITIISILLILILGIVLIFSLRDEKLDSTYINDSIKVSYYENNEIVLDKKNNSVDYYFEVESNKDNGSYNISLVTENKTNASDDKIRVSILKNGEYIVGGKETGEVITSEKLGELLSNQTTGKNSKDVYVLKIWSEEVVNNGTFKVSVNVEEVKKEEVKIINVKFDADGGLLEKKEVSIKENGTYGALPVPNKEGYRFIGWYSSKDNGVLVNKDTKYLDVKANTLYAKYEYFLEVPKEDISNKVEDDKVEEPKVEELVVVKKEYTITFNSNGGSDIASITKLEGESLGEVPVPQREGYNFVGWDIEYPSVMPSNNLTLNAKWKAKTFVITLMFNDTINVNKNVIYDDTYGTLPDVVREGYTFVGWFDSKENGNQIKSDDIVKLSKNITLYARTQANSYTVKFNTGTSEILEDMVFVYDSEYKDLPVINRTGYRFDGWYFEPEFDNKVNNGDIVKITTDTILFAKYTPNKYTITFDFGYDTLDKEINYGEAYGELPVASKDGYNFIGWFTEGSDGIQVTKEMLYELSANQKLYARYEAKKFNISFETYGGSSHEMIQVTYDDIYGALPTPEKTGYTFNGWYLDEEFNKAITALDTVKILEDSTLYAKFTANKYTLTMDFNLNVTDMMSKEITYDQPYGDLIQPTKYGYTFMGWYTSKEGGELITEDTIVKVTNDLTIYARWNQSGVLKMYGNTKQSRLPLEYRELEYIESTGTQYIDTGVLAGSNVKIEIDGVFKYIEGKTYVTGGRDDFDTNRIALFSNSNYFDFQFGTKGVGYDNVANTRDDVRKLISFSKSGVYINNELKVDGTDQEFTSSCNIYLFAVNKGEEIQYGSGTQLYNYKIYVDGVLILDFVPAYRKSDAEVGLYNLVDGKFYINEGTGRFKAGKFIDDVTMSFDNPVSVTSVGEKTKNLFEFDKVKTSPQKHSSFELTDNGFIATGILNPSYPNSWQSGYVQYYSKNALESGQYTVSWYHTATDYDIPASLPLNIYGFDSSGNRNFEKWINALYDENTNRYSFVMNLTEKIESFYIEVPLFGTTNVVKDAQIEVGSVETNFEPYGYKIPFNVVGKNIANPQYIYDYVDRIHIIDNYTEATKIFVDSDNREIFKLMSDSGYVGLEGKSGYDEFRKIFYDIFEENTQYTISFDYYTAISNQGMNIQLVYTDGTIQKNGDLDYIDELAGEVYSYKFTTLPNKTLESICLFYNSGATYIYMDTLQIEKGTVATEYEPYKIKDVVKTGKNLFNSDKYTLSSGYYFDGTGKPSSADKRLIKVQKMPIKANTTYSLSSNLKIYNVWCYAGGKPTDKVGAYVEKYSYTFNTSSNCEQIAISLRNTSGAADTVAFDWLQLEENDAVTDYEPYYEYKNVIYLDEPLRCIDGYCDYIDFEKKQVNRVTQKLTFDGVTELNGGTWYYWEQSNTGNTLGVYYYNYSVLGEYQNGKFVRIVALSNYFTNSTMNPSIALDSDLGSMVAHPGSWPPYLGFKVPFTNLDDWKGYLSEQAKKDKPLEVYYALLEPLQENVIAPDIELNDGETLFVNTSVKPSKIE